MYGNGSGRFLPRDHKTTPSSTWETLYTHADTHGYSKFTHHHQRSCNAANNKERKKRPFVSQHHSVSFDSPPPVGSKHDLIANDLLSVLLPTNPLMHVWKFSFVLLLLFGLLLFLPAVAMVMTVYRNDEYHSSNATIGTILENTFLSSFFGVLPWWTVCGIASILWTYYYYSTTLCHWGKPWMDPKVFGVGRQDMHVPLRLFGSVQNARLAACRPDLASFSTGPLDKAPMDCHPRQLQQQHVVSNLTSNVWLLDPLPSWTFQLFSTVEQALKAVQQTKEAKSTMHNTCITNMPIPSNWMLHPHVDDIPIYTNQKYPFPCQPPVVPVDNPTGMYQLELNQHDPALWPTFWNSTCDDNKTNPVQYSLVLHGIESACFVYWNGTCLGYCQDSRLPSEFIVPSDTLWDSAGKGLLQLVVIRWSDGSYLEDQDHWWMAGIHRSVELIRRPSQADIMDYHVLADHHGHIRVSVSVRQSTNQVMLQQQRRTKVRVQLFQDEQLTADGSQYKMADAPLWTDTQTTVTEKSSVLEFQHVIPNSLTWTAETPHLYTLVLEQLDEDGKVLYQCESCRVGFRSVAIDHHHDNNDTDGGKAGILKVNGRPITVCGINRHEHDPDWGKVISLKRMMQEITILKQNNFNAIRTSHYPAHSSFYRLCDFYGMYVCDEANIETHGLKPMGRLAHDAGWESAMISRVTRMAQRDYNHACIILWSLGNEAGRGRSLIQARQRLLQLDTSRPICYESGGLWGEGTGRSELTDVVCPMYTSVPRLQELHQRIDEDRPIVLCEYSHSMNNSNGNLHLYWEKFWDPSFPRLQGGFIWDFKDQGLRKTTQNGRPFFAFGGDFGDVINDQQFCINGMFSPDLKPHPSVNEIKYLQQPVKITSQKGTKSLSLPVSLVTDGKASTPQFPATLLLENRYTFRDLTHLQWRWELCCSVSQHPIGSGSAEDDGERLVIDWSNFASHLLELEFKHTGVQYFLNVTASLKESSTWANAGHDVAKEQFIVTVAVDWAVEKTDQHVPIRNDVGHRVYVRETAHDLEVISTDVRNDPTIPFVVFSKLTGSMQSLCWDGEKEMLGRNGMAPNFTRATTDNDRGGLELVLEHVMLKWAQPAFFLSSGFQYFSHYMHWKQNGLTQDQPPHVVCDDMTYDQREHLVVVKAKCSARNVYGTIVLRLTTTYTICGRSGQIQVHCKVIPQKCLRNIPSLPRIGLSLELNPSLCHIRYLGRGPNECYPDRKTGSQLGIWTTSPSKMGYDYIVPSETGNRSDCQWVSFEDIDNGGSGILIATSHNETFEFSALLHTPDELNHARHTCDLDERKAGQHSIFVNIDHQLMGIGGDLSWFPCVYPEFLVKADHEYEYWLRLVPLSSRADLDNEVAVFANQIRHSLQ
ncbi:beta-galactosidase [Nitzschia inconspicua]|uniref:beta-galactosidase n=1 Tax=Nitzschia inconspicua TaxID=303405 RepID=A0A9K3KKB2_9STRA|nr:beta-galactosidase [Nitzschia inconspicua]